MKWNSIRTKVFAALICCLCAGLGGTVALMRYSFERNSAVLATSSVGDAQRLFTILETREISKMTAVTELLSANPQVRDALIARDRSRLLELTAPLYQGLKKEGITNWIFHTSEPDMAVFLRLHNPAKFGDRLNRFMDHEAVRTHAPVHGNELAKAGFAVRTLSPIYDSSGAVTGYIELGEELGQFIHAMKRQTGNDYGLLLNKKFVDRQFWADSSAALKRHDDWDDNSNYVIADTTANSNSIFGFDGDLASVPAPGRVVERFQTGNSVFVRGLFPIHDTAGNTVGAMFVVHDISGAYLAAKHTQNILVDVTVISMLVGAAVFLALLNRLVFRRLTLIIAGATQVVGGDYETKIPMTSDDEVGRLEELFEQFRQVFVDVLSHVPELQGKG